MFSVFFCFDDSNISHPVTISQKITHKKFNMQQESSRPNCMSIICHTALFYKAQNDKIKARVYTVLIYCQLFKKQLIN